MDFFPGVAMDSPATLKCILRGGANFTSGAFPVNKRIGAETFGWDQVGEQTAFRVTTNHVETEQAEIIEFSFSLLLNFSGRDFGGDMAL